MELTPVQSIEHEGMPYLRKEPGAGKVYHTRMNPDVRVVLCDRKGTPKGTWLDGEARLLGGAEHEHTKRIPKSGPGCSGTSPSI